MQTTASLIDNMFVSTKLHRSFDSLIVINDMSDHLPSLVLLKQTKITDKSPLILESRTLNEAEIGRIKHKLCQIDWNGELNSSDVNENFQTFCDMIKTTMDTVTPL